MRFFAEWTKFNAVFLSSKRASDISPFPLVPRGPLGRLYSHLAKRGRTGAKT